MALSRQHSASIHKCVTELFVTYFTFSKVEMKSTACKRAGLITNLATAKSTSPLCNIPIMPFHDPLSVGAPK
jgi:hypothetical protein